VIGASTVQGNLNACADDGAPNYEQAALGIDIGGGMAVDTVNNRLFVADPADARVMVFSTPVTSNGENAIGVLGSTNYAYNNGGTTIKVFAGGSGASGPSDVAYDSAHHFLYVADTMNNRVMVFNVPTGFTNGENAIFELGQNPASFTTKTAAATQSGMNTPSALAYDPVNQRLFVADSGNSRVLMFNTVSLASGENATTVFGQTSFTGHGSNTTQTTMNTPDGLAYDSNNNRLFVTDGLNLRVLVFDVTPSNVANTNARNGPTSGSAYSAIFELGQAAGTTQFTTSNTGVTQSELGVDANAPNYPFVDGLYYDPGSGRLFVADILNNRVMIFESSAITSPVQHGFIPGYE
jgi:DNA-binding beta-propeller fold protein YncE